MTGGRSTVVNKPASFFFTISECLWMTSNNRPGSWYGCAPKVRALKEIGYYAGRSVPRAKFTKRVKLTVRVHLRSARVFDPLNAEPTVKPLLDGLVLAGVVDDDNFTVVDGPYCVAGEPRRDLKKGERALTFDFEPIGEVSA